MRVRITMKPVDGHLNPMLRLSTALRAASHPMLDELERVLGRVGLSLEPGVAKV